MSPTLPLALVSVATGVLSPVLGKLSTLLEKKYSSLKGVGDEISALQDELSSMRALLLKLADIDDLDVQVKVWRNQVRELSYEIEDCIDDFVRRVERDPDKRKNMKGFFQESIHKLRTLGARSEIASKILKLKARVDHAGERRIKYNFDGVVASSCSTVVHIDPRLPALYAESESLVGIDEPRDELIEWLAEGEANSVRKVKVVSVVGLGGLGKTTLARQVYDKIGEQFDCRAFVSVSQKPDMKKILRTILTAVEGTIEHYPGIEGYDEKQLIDKLRCFLNDKRYFVVIDDIWSKLACTTIRCALLENNLSSRILITTRNASVARSCCSPEYSNVYEMKPLSDVYARKLFVKRIFGAEDQCPPHLKDASGDILRKCGGLPLAVISIASLLASKRGTAEELERYRNYVGSAFEDDPSVDNMQRILALSYNDLPHYLKTCLLYLSMFPEDFVIPRDQLVRRWIAEGFISTDSGERLEQVGESYYNELINRSMIMPATQQWDRKAAFCRVHDVILDLIVSKSIEENFVTVFRNNNHIWGSQDKARRLLLDWRDQANLMVPSSMDLSKARSFSIYGSSEHMPLLSDFQALRMIYIEHSNLENHYFADIGRLFQLKYLGLNGVGISKLPDQIGELQQLETLELRWTGIKELPKNIVRLKKLVFLYASNVRLFEGIGNLKALQEVRYVKVDSSTPTTCLEELGNLTELRYLGIDWLVSDTSSDHTSYTDIFVSCIDRLCRFKFRYLNIGCDVKNGMSLDFLVNSWSPPPCHLQNFVMRSGYHFPRIPEWVALLSNVTLLDMNINPVGEEVLRVLGCLPYLQSLALNTTEVVPGEKLIIFSSGFQSLEEFFFNWNIAMGPLVFEVGAMPKLVRFVYRLVARCVGSPCGDFYLGLQQLPSLKHLFVDIDCRGANADEVQTTEAAIKNATDLTLSHLRINFSKLWMDQMVTDEDVGSVEGSEHMEGEGQAESSTKVLLERHFRIFSV